ncbi:hypothetical protein [Nocardia sp. NPDC057668]|uniref:hypothetical protein n=1 Tax=Nocardia sp. NPDC057668 TaxID=3346202 RepID=UPI0036712D18
MAFSLIDNGEDDERGQRRDTVSVSVSITVSATMSVSANSVHQVTGSPVTPAELTAVTTTAPVPHTPPPALAPAPAPAPAATTSAATGPYVVMTLDRGLLPHSLEFSVDWPHRVPPKDVGSALYEAYRTALTTHTAHASDELGRRRHRRRPARHSPDHRLTLRDQTIMLLETTTWNKYCRLQDELLSDGQYLMNGAATQYGRAVVAVSGNRDAIHAIEVAPTWPGCADPYALETELMWCADRIRALRPKFAAQHDWSAHTDDELLELQQRHRRKLIELSAR